MSRKSMNHSSLQMKKWQMRLIWHSMVNRTNRLTTTFTSRIMIQQVRSKINRMVMQGTTFWKKQQFPKKLHKHVNKKQMRHYTRIRNKKFFNVWYKSIEEQQRRFRKWVRKQSKTHWRMQIWIRRSNKFRSRVVRTVIISRGNFLINGAIKKFGCDNIVDIQTKSC